MMNKKQFLTLALLLFTPLAFAVNYTQNITLHAVCSQDGYSCKDVGFTTTDIFDSTHWINLQNQLAGTVSNNYHYGPKNFHLQDNSARRKGYEVDSSCEPFFKFNKRTAEGNGIHHIFVTVKGKKIFFRNKTYNRYVNCYDFFEPQLLEDKP